MKKKQTMCVCFLRLIVNLHFSSNPYQALDYKTRCLYYAWQWWTVEGHCMAWVADFEIYLYLEKKLGYGLKDTTSGSPLDYATFATMKGAIF